MTYTLAKFVRDAKAGMSLELIERFGKTGDEILERLRGERKITKVSTYKMELINAQGQTSYLCFNSAKLVEYDGEYLTVYDPIRRELTSDEQHVLDKINSIKDFSCKFEYIKSSPCHWISPYGSKQIKGKTFIPHENKVIDRSMRGKRSLKYRVIKLANS